MEQIREKVVELLNQAAFLPSEKERISNLVQVQELVIHRDPTLLDSFFDEVVAFQTDRNSDVRNKSDSAMLPRLIPNLQILINDDVIAVVKRVVQAVTQVYRATLAMLSTARIVNQEMEQTWYIISDIKNTIFNMIDHDNDGVRTQAIKFLEALILMQTYPEADSVLREGEFNLDSVPLTLKVARPRKLEDEAKQAMNRVIKFQSSIHISSVNLMTCMSSMTIIAKARPQFMGKIIISLELLHANLPPTLTKSQVNSVRKHLRLQLFNLMRHAAAYDYIDNITAVLSDLGVSSAEMNKILLGKEEIRKRVRREKTFEESDDSVVKRPRKTETYDLGMHEPVDESNRSAIDITQKWIQEGLSIDAVTSIVMITMLDLPDVMPPLFSAAYTPVTAAGTSFQIQHVSRLLASQLTATGYGPGAQILTKDSEFGAEIEGSDDEDSKAQRIVLPNVKEELRNKYMPVLLPAGVAGFSSKQRKSVELTELTKPLSKQANKEMQILMLTRLIQEKNCFISLNISKQQLHLLTILAGSLDNVETDSLIEYAVDDLSNRYDLLLSLLYSLHIATHDFASLSSFLKDSLKSEKSDPSVGLFQKLLKKLLAQPYSRQRDEYISKLMLESPILSDEILSDLMKAGAQNEVSLESYAITLKDIAIWRTVLSEAAVEKLALLITHEHDTVRDLVLPHLLELLSYDETRKHVVTISQEYLRALVEQEPPVFFAQHYLGRPIYSSEWNESFVKACLYVFLAILPMQQHLIHDLAEVYIKTVNEAKRCILRLLEVPIGYMGMDSFDLLMLVETCPKGSETLITRIIHILTEKAPPSDALVCRVRELYNKRVSDVRFLIPVLTGLSKKEVISVLPKLIKLNPHVVKQVFNRLWGVTLDTGTSPLNPVELLVALHLIDNEKCDVKTVIKATSMCFTERSVYTAEVLALALQQLLEQQTLPTLFMRTVLQTLTIYPKLTSFVVNILQKLVSREIWNMPKMWEGFVKCCQRAIPQSFNVLLQLSPKQLLNVFSEAPDIKEQLTNHVHSLSDYQRNHIDQQLLDAIEGDMGGSPFHSYSPYSHSQEV